MKGRDAVRERRARARVAVAVVCAAVVVVVVVVGGGHGEMLTNPQFRDGTAQWSVWCSAAPCPEAQASFEGLSLAIPGTHTDQVGVVQCARVRGGARLVLSAVVQARVPPEHWVCAKLGFFTATGTPAAGEVVGECVGETDHPHQVQVSATAPQDTATVCGGVGYAHEGMQFTALLQVHRASLRHAGVNLHAGAVLWGWVLVLGALVALDPLVFPQATPPKPSHQGEGAQAEREGERRGDSAVALGGVVDVERGTAHLRLQPPQQRPHEDEGQRQSQPQQQCQPRDLRSGRLTSLGFARLVAALHITLVHLYTADDFAFAAWGASWVPFYFLLSGFVLAHSASNAAWGKGLCLGHGFSVGALVRFLHRRLLSVYPLYILSVVVALPRARLACASQRTTLAAMVLLVHGWALSYDCEHEDGECADTVLGCINNHVNVPSWFLTSLVAFWVAFPLLFRAVGQIANDPPKLVGALALAWAYGHAIVLLPAFPHTTLKYSPLEFVHIFAAGVVLSRLHAWIIATRQQGALGGGGGGFRVPVVVRYGASLASIALLHVMLAFPVSDPLVVGAGWQSGDTAIEWVARCGGFVPLHSLLVLGLALGDDPLARLFATPWLAWVGEASYAWYILQEFAFHVSEALRPLHGTTGHVSTYCVLLVLALLAHHCVHVPIVAYFGSSSAPTAVSPGRHKP